MIPNIWGGHFFIGIQGLELTASETHWFLKHGAAGVVLFARNILDPAQLLSLMGNIKALCMQSPLGEPPLFCIDMEGGRISELKAPYFKTWPAALDYLNQNPNLSLHDFGLEMGTYLRQLGFQVNFAPCLDILSNPDNQLIQGRSLGESSSQVVAFGQQLIAGYLDAQILPAAKHFPGHGHTVADSHFELPVDLRSLAELEDQAFKPFCMASQMEVPFFMTAHVMYPKVDPELPATLSPIWLKDIMRDRLKITQFCLADDLDMQALSQFGSPSKIASQFLNSGGDFLMYCHRPEPPFEVIESLSQGVAADQLARLSRVSRTLSRMKLAF